MKTRLSRLIQLNAKVDQVLEFRRVYEDEEDSLGTTVAKTGGAVAGGGAIGYGAYKADQAIMGKYGRRNTIEIGPSRQAVNPGRSGFTINDPSRTHPLYEQVNGGRSVKTPVGRIGAYNDALNKALENTTGRVSNAYRGGSHVASVVKGRGGSALEALLAGLKRSGKMLFHR